MRERKTWLIRIRLLADKGCAISEFKRKLKGTGVEIDTNYQPKRVGPALYVGRGFATARAVRVAQQGTWRAGPHGSRYLRRTPRKDILFFEEIRFEDVEKTPTTLDDLWGDFSAERRFVTNRAERF